MERNKGMFSLWKRITFLKRRKEARDYSLCVKKWCKELIPFILNNKGNKSLNIRKMIISYYNIIYY